MRWVRRGAVLAGLALLAGSIPATSIGAATTEVSVDDYEFDAERVRIAVGDAVHWTTGPEAISEHNVRENGAIFRSGDESLDVDFTVVFSAGTFHYFCEPHLGWDMVGVVRVPASIKAAPSGLPFTVRWAVPGSGSGDRFDVKYRVGNGSWKLWKTRTSALKGVFGKNGKPVPVSAGTRYSFKVRSRSGSAASAWSPVSVFRP
jgi:plastocyanin